LAGKPAKSAREIFANFPAIERAEYRLTPFWKKTFPKVESSLLLKGRILSKD
jgi:hypothetical protein